MRTRKTKLVDCNPKWTSWHEDGRYDGVTFDCPEGHPHCFHTVPFTPDMDGQNIVVSPASNGALWTRIGDTFDTLTLHPSVKRKKRESGPCQLHVKLLNGTFEFCSDSK
jgi:hypothetical protein